MPHSELQQALANWIDQANSPLGKLPDSSEPAEWVANQFMLWWKEHAEEQLTDVQSAASSLRAEIQRLSEKGDHEEALHELTHLTDALSDLSSALGMGS